MSWTGVVEGGVETEMEFYPMLIRKDLLKVGVLADRVIYWLAGGPYDN